MGMKNNINVKNDWLMAGILSTLIKQNSETTTSELKTQTGADSTHLISYRLDKLESAGYVQTGKMSMEDWDSPGIPPRTASLTREGRDFAERCDLSGWDEPDTMARRVERLERKLGKQNELIKQLLVATGLHHDSPLPPVHNIRAGFTGIDDAIGELSGGDVDVNDFVAKWASDEFQEIEQQLD